MDPLRKWLGALVLALACSSSSEMGMTTMPPAMGAPTYVGKISGADALIALVVDQDAVVAYSCGRGDALATHTGWFFTELEGQGDERPLRASESASGLMLTGTVSSTLARGTLKLASGAELPFTAEPARPGTTAGLYQRDGAEALSGLIVTNDLEAAGNTRIAPALTTTAVSTPIAVSTATLSAPPTGTLTVTLTTSATNLTPTTGTLPKVVLPPAIRRNGPVLVILTHGMSHFIDTPPEVRDTPPYSRDEWGTDFVRGLLGAGETEQIPLFNFRNQDIRGDNFIKADLLPKYDETMPEDAIAQDPNLPAHFITTAPIAAAGALGQPPAPPPITLFITYRNSLGGLVASGKRIADQAYVALRHYEARFKVTPGVILIGHSFGNLAHRFVLSNPPATAFPPNTPPLNPENLTVTDTERARMDYLRDRVLYTVSLGGPHEGSPMADVNIPIQMALQQVLLQPAANLTGTALAVLQGLDTLDAVARQDRPSEQLLQDANAGLQAAIRELDSPALRDLRSPFWVTANTGPLHPGQAHRSGSTPIVGAASSLIPVYAIGGRSPGDRVFDSPDLIAGVERYGQRDAKEQTWITKNMFGGDLVVKALGGGAGAVNRPVFNGFSGQLDRRGRISDYRTFVKPLAEDVLGRLPIFVQDAFDNTADEVINYLTGIQLHALEAPIHIDRTYVLDLSGRITLPVPALRCTDGGNSFQVVMDLGPLLTALAGKFGSIHASLTAIANLDVNGLLALLAAQQDLSTTTAQWVLDHAAPLATASGTCKLPTGVGDILSAANIVNWKLATATSDFPAPAWKRTDTPVSDGEIDSDGVVPFTSAMGFSLGTGIPEFFDHRRNDGPNGRPGSWYRFYDSPMETMSHAMQHQHPTGKFVRDAILAAGAGPVPGPGPLSVFP
jgi:hypothetical protein